MKRTTESINKFSDNMKRMSKIPKTLKMPKMPKTPKMPSTPKMPKTPKTPSIFDGGSKNNKKFNNKTKKVRFNL